MNHRPDDDLKNIPRKGIYRILFKQKFGLSSVLFFHPPVIMSGTLRLTCICAQIFVVPLTGHCGVNLILRCRLSLQNLTDSIGVSAETLIMSGQIVMGGLKWTDCRVSLFSQSRMDKKRPYTDSVRSWIHQANPERTQNRKRTPSSTGPNGFNR